MTHFFKCQKGKLCGFLTALLFAFTFSFAQDFQKQKQEQLRKLDLAGIGNALFLNAGITNERECDYFRKRSKSLLPASEKVSSEEWANLYERLMGADLRPEGLRISDIGKFIETDPEKLTKNNVVPIGIMNMESIHMSVKQLSENEADKKLHKPVEFTSYERFDIVYASVLQEDVYQADVEFRFDNSLYITNREEKLAKIELDFGDGKGFIEQAISGKTISHQFESTGIKAIFIRFTANGKLWNFETKINVRQLERIKPYKEFQITANRISVDTGDATRSARTMLVGGNIRIILGCDQILNKPIIIAEGFDMGQDVMLDNIEANYRTPLNQYLLEGYDLVLLDYTDGRAAMEDNAQVLKALIQQVNQLKTGNAQSIVIGESMSGLVARWALRQMENEGIAHQVKLMICYDTPHQGVNVPVGLTQLLWEANPSMLTNVILKFFTKGWRNYYQALGTPAAAQMLLHWGGQFTGGVGSKAPAFDVFRNQLIALGNGGYPQNCRNVAIIHGSMNASDRDIFTNYNYGSRILRSWTPFGLQNTNIDVHTNQLNQNENIFRFGAWGIIAKAVWVNRSYNSPVNDDFLPGGRTAFPVPNKLFFSTSSFEFCFVPTFSSIDYQGARASQVERELLNIETMNPSQTPFAAIYGNNENTTHVNPFDANFVSFGFAEGLLNLVSACPVLPIPPVPVISNYLTCYPFSQKRSTENNTANITVSLAAPSNGQYIHNWTVLPTQQTFTTTEDQITFQAERPGAYQIICVRTYPNRRDLQSTFEIIKSVSDCSVAPGGPENPNPSLVPDSDIKASDVWEGDFLLTTDVDSLAVFAHYTPDGEILYATLEDGSFIPRSTLEASGMFPEFAALFTENDPRIALPVKLKEFHAEAENKTAILTWATTAEINSDHFEIQRSKSGKEWQTIASVTASAVESGELAYSYTDQNPPFNVAYYRLKMVDQDSSFAYSRVEMVRFEGGREIAVFPNPVDKDGHLQILPSGDMVSDVRIYNLSGKLVFQSVQPEKELNVQDLPVGRYILKIRLKDGSQTSRAFVKR